MERVYESMLVLRPDLGDEEREDVLQKIVKKIEGLNGKVFASKMWAKERNLCYSLRSRGAEKKRYNKGLYWLINFTLDTDKLFELGEMVKLEERLLRNIIVKREAYKA